MGLQVTLEVEVCVKHPRAMRALEPLLATVHFNMLVEVSLLSEAKLAALVGTVVGPFVGVDPQVIEEVVPFPKMFSAIVEIAFQDLDIPLRLGVLEREDAEFFSTGHVLLDLNGLEVEGLACLHMHCDVFSDTLECVTVFDIFHCRLVLALFVIVEGCHR